MMIVMHADATQEQISSVVARVEASGLQVHLSSGAERTVIGVVGDSRKIQPENYMHLAGYRTNNADHAPLQNCLPRIYT